MKKSIGLLVLGMFFLVALISFSSAAYYGGRFDPSYGRDNYDAYHSFTAKTTGSYYGPRTTTTTNYDKVSEKFWDGNSWVDRTSYVTVKRQTPSYPTYTRGYMGYGNYQSYPLSFTPSYNNYGNYPMYNSYGNNYGNYGGYGNYGSNYGNYNYNNQRTSYW
ncbi:hypothetical protein J4233_05840 [Candidatus Pacearchaeota archaeon]|nr:hypothetical protein [uncultured archaeon]MBS3077758.1 hypothetical protein [Candidatus Pacearchaeota archaeon]